MRKRIDMVAGVNFIITNVRTKIPDFGLQVVLAADTEFKPYTWFVKIGGDGMAYAESATSEEFFAFRRKLYPNGYKGYGAVDPLEYPDLFRDEPKRDEPKGIARAVRSVTNWLSHMRLG